MFDWDTEDLEEEEGLIEQTVTHPELPAAIPGVELEEEQVNNPVVEDNDITEAQEATAAAVNANIDQPANVITEEATHLPDVPTGVDEVTDEEMLEAITEEDEDEDDTEPELPTILPPITPIIQPLPTPLIHQRPQRTQKQPGKYNPSTGRNYEDGVMHINTNENKIEPMDEEEHMEHLIGVVLMQQYNLSKVLNKFGNKGKIAVTK